MTTGYLHALALGAVIDEAELAAGWLADPAAGQRAHHLVLAAQFLVRPLEAELMAQVEADTSGVVDTEGGAP